MADVDPRLFAPFVVLAEETHFGRAAARLHVSQPALSQQLQRLERQVGVALFERDSRRVRLAPGGQALLDGVRESLRIARRAVEEARRAGGTQVELRLGVDIDCPDVLVRRLRAFGAARPDLELRLTIQQQDDMVRDVVAGRVDLGVGWTAAPPGEPAVECSPLTSVELHGVVRADDPRARGQQLSRAGMAGDRLVMYQPSPETRPFYDFFLSSLTDARGQRPEVTHVRVLDDAQAAMLDQVQQDGGFTLSVAHDPHVTARTDLVALAFDPPVAAEIVALWRAGQRPSHVDELRTFLEPTGRRTYPTSRAERE